MGHFVRAQLISDTGTNIVQVRVKVFVLPTKTPDKTLRPHPRFPV